MDEKMIQRKIYCLYDDVENFSQKLPLIYLYLIESKLKSSIPKVNKRLKKDRTPKLLEEWKSIES